MEQPQKCKIFQKIIKHPLKSMSQVKAYKDSFGSSNPCDYYHYRFVELWAEKSLSFFGRWIFSGMSFFNKARDTINILTLECSKSWIMGNFCYSYQVDFIQSVPVVFSRDSSSLDKNIGWFSSFLKTFVEHSLIFRPNRNIGLMISDIASNLKIFTNCVFISLASGRVS